MSSEITLDVTPHHKLAPKPVLLSALLEAASDKNYERRETCSRALDEPELLEQEIRDGCPYCTLRQEVIWKCFPGATELQTDHINRHGVINGTYGTETWERAGLFVTDGKCSIAVMNLNI